MNEQKLVPLVHCKILPEGIGRAAVDRVEKSCTFNSWISYRDKKSNSG